MLFFNNIFFFKTTLILANNKDKVNQIEKSLNNSKIIA